jgi:hypothetical protein
MTAYDTAVLANSPTAYYKFEESSGQAQDSSGNGRHATTTTVAAYSVATGNAQRNNCFTFTGSTARVVVPQSVISGMTANFSIEFWGKGTTYGGQTFDQTNTGGNEWVESIWGNGDGKLWIYAPGKQYPGWHKSASTSINDGNWHHIVYTFATSGTMTCKLYIDGSLDSTFALGTGTLSLHASNSLNLGANTGNDYAHGGQLDSFAFYSTTLTATDVTNHYNANSQVDVTVAAPSAAVTFTPQAPSLSLERYVTVAAPSPANVTFTKQDATVSTFNSLTVVATVADITFAALAPFVDDGVTYINTTTANIAFGKYDPSISVLTQFTEVSFDGSIQSWVDMAQSGSNATLGTYINQNAFWVQNIDASGTTQSMSATIVTKQAEYLNQQLTVDWQIRRNGNESNNFFQATITDLTTLQSTNFGQYYGNGITETLHFQNTVNLLPARRYRIRLNYNGSTKVYPLGEWVQVDTLTYTYEQGTATITVSPNAPNIAYSASSPTVVIQYTVLAIPDNVPTVLVAGKDATIQTPGTVSIGTNAAIITVLAPTPTLSVIRNVQNDITNTVDLGYIAPNPTVIMRADSLAFKYIDPDYIGFTSNDADLLQSIDLGSMFYGQEKIFAFKIGNTSTVACNLLVSCHWINLPGRIQSLSNP